MANVRAIELGAIKEAMRKLESFLDAAKGNKTSCAVFDGPNIFNEAYTDRQKEQIIMYVESWIAEPLRLALKGIEGDRTFTNDDMLRSWSRNVRI